MKIEVKDKCEEFRPFTVEMTVETQEEFRRLEDVFKLHYTLPAVVKKAYAVWESADEVWLIDFMGRVHGALREGGQ